MEICSAFQLLVLIELLQCKQAEALNIKPVLKFSPHHWPDEGDPVTLSCEVKDSSLNWRYLWYRVRGDLKDELSDSFLEPLSDSSREAGGSYNLGPVTPEHSGQYVCRAKGGEPTYQTDYSDVETLWVTDSHWFPGMPSVTPHRAQHFSSDSLSLRCHTEVGFQRWRLRWKTNRHGGQECPLGWTKKAGSKFTCSTIALVQSDSGMYWCESDNGRYSNAVNITVTAGDVILESSAHSVRERDPLTLRCTYQNSPSSSSADFYKDGSLLQTQATGDMTIPAVSKANEGFYKCQHPELGESPESWVKVLIRNGHRKKFSIMTSAKSWLTEGDSVTLTCMVKSSSKWTYLWYRVVPYREDLPYIQYRWGHYSAELLSDSSRGAGGSYTLSPAVLQHIGLYVCRAVGGDPTYQTAFSSVRRLWVVGLYPPASLVVTPNRVQHFFHNSLSMSCKAQDKLSRWNLRWETGRPDGPECPLEWTSEAASTCSIRSLSYYDWGVYWCESESREYSNAVTIVVTDNNVILDSPAHPVAEGDPLTLQCISRKSSANFTADFSKDKLPFQTQTTGEMTIAAVSKAHNGLYRCSYQVLGRSPPSQIRVINRNASFSILSIQPGVRVSPHSWVTEGDSVTLTCDIMNTSLNWTFLWYRVVSFSKDLPYVQNRQQHYSAELLSDSSRGAGGSYTLSPAALKHTGFYVCRAEGGEPTYQTGFSKAHLISINSLSLPASLVIRPNRSQHFANGPISVSCEFQDNSTKWKLKWQTGKCECATCPYGWTSKEESTCSTRHLSRHHDSGLYWCGSESGQYSNLVHITVTSHRNVILESPATAVTEGDSLTLRCLSRNGTSVNSAEFYKNKSLIQTTTTGEMTIPSISKTDEGIYECRHPELGKSPRSWVIVIRSSMSVFRLVSSLVVVSPYLLVTIMLVVQCLRFKSRSKENEDEGKHEVSEAETCL